MEIERLRDDLRDIADEAAPADLYRRVLRTSRTRRRRRAAGALATAAAVVAAGFGLMPAAGERAAPPVRPAVPPSPTTVRPDKGPARFVPPADSTGGRTSLQLVLPDGTVAELSHPRGQRIAELGFEPRVRLLAPFDDQCCQAATRLTGSPRLLRTLPGADGKPVEIWRGVAPFTADSEEPENGQALFARFGRWYLFIADQEPVGQDSRWRELGAFVRALDVHETAQGYLVVRGSRPVRFEAAGAAGDAEWTGPELASFPTDERRPRRLRVARVKGCPPNGPIPGSVSLPGWQLCKDGVAVRISSGDDDQDWVRRVRDGLRIERVTR
ncbi:hypothetical protein ACFVH6_11505 [Spirillospora sp. NPDC127200]